MENRSAADQLATLIGISVNTGGNKILNDISLVIHKGEQWAFIGHSGSGKTTLAKVFTGKVFYSGSLRYHFSADAHAALVAQQHHFKNLSNTSSFYYQQRFNASGAEDSITVGQVLEGFKDTEGWTAMLHLDGLLAEPILQLSNGENKRLQLARALLTNPALLVLDNPFLGLDAEGRQTLHTMLDRICSKGIHIILITSPAELPGCITHIGVLENGVLVSTQKKQDYRQQLPMPPAINNSLLRQLPVPENTSFELAVAMKNVTIRYGEKTILDGINWQVRKGECWNLSGPNGAGKSTLLSLITADNPQAYANKIILFDKQRGSGESIWDIKRKIGFVSPELHLYFEQTATCFEVIASGMFDTIGLFRPLSATQQDMVLLWLQLMELLPFQHKRICELSTGQQRMALLARALIKNPPLLILDEPTQGLDETQTAWFKELINQICRQFGTTLIYVSHYTSDLPSCINKYLRLENGVVRG